MKRWISIVLSAAAALMIVGVLGVANADTGPAPATTATPPARVITVNGAGARGVADNAPAAEATAAYGQALADALADAKGKAQALATATGVALGSVQSLVEQSNTPISGCQGGYAMAAESDAAKRPAKPARAPKPARKSPSDKKKKKPAKASSRTVAPDAPTGCSVDASLTVSYAVTGG